MIDMDGKGAFISDGKRIKHQKITRTLDQDYVR